LEEYKNIKDEELINSLEQISKVQKVYSFTVNYKKLNTELEI